MHMGYHPQKIKKYIKLNFETLRQLLKWFKGVERIEARMKHQPSVQMSNANKRATRNQYQMRPVCFLIACLKKGVEEIFKGTFFSARGETMYEDDLSSNALCKWFKL